MFNRKPRPDPHTPAGSTRSVDDAAISVPAGASIAQAVKQQPTTRLSDALAQARGRRRGWVMNW